MAEIWGFCLGCDRWFYAEKWMDRQAPAPVCPVCGADPQRIENRDRKALARLAASESLAAPPPAPAH